MRQIPTPSVKLRPGDTVAINFELQVRNDLPRKKITLVAVRWEPVWGTELSAAEREQLESTAVLLVPPSTTPVGSRS